MIGLYLVRQSLLSLVVLCLCLVLGAGIVRLLVAGHARQQAQHRMEQSVGEWHEQLSAELPASQRQAWDDLGHRAPEAMLRVCAFERPGRE